MGFLSGLKSTFGIGAAQDAKNASKEAVEVFDDIETPEVSDLRVKLKNLVSQGKIKPEEAETIFQEQSGLKGYQQNEQARNAQISALQGLQDTVDSGGLDAEAKANLNEARSQENTAQRGNREAILANARARGVGGTGLEFASSLANEQGSASRSADAGFKEVALQEQRRREALSDLANTGTAVEAQQFGQANTINSAQDAINRFNAANQQAQVNKNVDLVNSAQEKNLAEKQRIADANVGTANQQSQANVSATQQDYENKLKKAQGKAAGYGVQANVGTSQAGVLPGIIGAGIAAGGQAAK